MATWGSIPAFVTGVFKIMSVIEYTETEGRSAGYIGLVGFLAALTLGALWAARYMEHQGHYVTGMSNQIVWGMPHVFAVFLIVAASGVLNVASVASVFGRAMYKPLARLSALLAIALLIGGLGVLVLDLGRPDRLIVAMTHFNFKSIFAWNMFLYTGFLALVAVYLWMLMERRFNRYSRAVGVVALVWRLVLTTGTGCIFGFLVARQAYDAAVMAPLFIAMSFAYGLAIFLLVLMAACRWTQRALGPLILEKLKKLLGIFVAAVLYFVAVQHLTNLYATEHHGVERFLLLEGGIYTQLFWIGQISLGSVLPLVIFFSPWFRASRGWTAVGAGLVVLGGLTQIYVIIIGAQAYPLLMFPGMDVLESGFYDGVVAGYRPSLPEIALGLGGVSVALLIVVIALKVLSFLPERLDDAGIAASDERAAEADA